MDNAIKPVWYEINSTRIYGVGGENQDGHHSSNFKQFPRSIYHITKQLDDKVALQVITELSNLLLPIPG